MYQHTKDDDILKCLETGAFIPRGHRDWPVAWLENNTPESAPPPPALAPAPSQANLLFEIETLRERLAALEEAAQG